MTQSPVHPTNNQKFWYGLRNISIGDEEETRIWEELTLWPEEARAEAQALLNSESPDYEAAYRSVLKWSITYEMGKLNNLRLFLLIENYLIRYIPEEASNAISMYALYKELESESGILKPPTRS